MQNLKPSMQRGRKHSSFLRLKFIKLTGGEPERGANNIWSQHESDIYWDVIRGLDNYWCSGCYTDVSL